MRNRVRSQTAPTARGVFLFAGGLPSLLQGGEIARELEAEPDFCLESTASGFGCDLAKVIVETASGIGQASGIRWSRMIEHVQSVHAKLE